MVLSVSSKRSMAVPHGALAHDSAVQTSRSADDESELLDVVDEHNVTSSSAPRAQVHREGLLHRAAHVMLFRKDYDGQHQMLVQQRARKKRVGPGLLDLSVAEHLHVGEDYASAAVRGLSEEIGLRVNVERLSRIADCWLRRAAYEDIAFYDNEFLMLFVVKYDGVEKDGPIVHDPKEVENVQWMSLTDLKCLVISNCCRFTPWFLEELARIDLFRVAQNALS